MPILEQKLDTEGLHDFLGRIYPIFQQTLGNKSASFQGVRISLKKKPYAKIDEIEYEWGFHHIVTKEITTGCVDREFCLPRAERIRYPRHYIDNADGLNIWERFKNNEQKYYISDESFDYLVVLSQRKDYIVLISAFPIDFEHYKRRLEREYKQHIRKPVETGNAPTSGTFLKAPDTAEGIGDVDNILEIDSKVK